MSSTPSTIGAKPGAWRSQRVIQAQQQSTPQTSCSKKTKLPGHALVIVYFTPPNGIRQYFIANESSYIPLPGGDVMRSFPDPQPVDDAGRMTYITTKEASELAKPNVHFVIRRPIEAGKNWKYTLQRPNDKWGFPKGGGVLEKDPSGNDIHELSPNIAVREFKEEVGYTLDITKLKFKKCVENKDLISIVFHYEVDANEKAAIETSYAAKNALKDGELFSASFMTKNAVLSKGYKLNKLSELAFDTIQTDIGSPDFTGVIPYGGTIDTSVPGGGAVRRRSHNKYRKTRRSVSRRRKNTRRKQRKN